MGNTLLKMNRQTGEFQTYYSRHPTSWYMFVINIKLILFVLAMFSLFIIYGLLIGLNFFTEPQHVLVLTGGSTLFFCFTCVAIVEGEFYKKVPVELKQLLDSTVNPYFVMYLPIRGRRGQTYFYIEDKDNAYVLDTLDCAFFNWIGMSVGERYLVVDGCSKLVDYDFCSKSPSDIAEIIVTKYPLFMNNSIESLRKRNKLYKVMMTEICS